MILLQELGLCALVATFSLHGSSGELQGGGVRIGDQPEFTFAGELLNGAGVENLEDLRGKPVLFDFWGRKCYACVGGSVPHSLELAKDYADDLTVVLVEAQGASRDEAEFYAYKKRWMEPPALWTNEVPFRSGGTGLPRFVLLSADGDVLMKGDPLRMRKEIDEAIEEEIKRVRKGPKGTPRGLQRAYDAFADGRFGQALSLSQKIKSGRYGDQATVALASFHDLIERRFVRIERLIQRGYYAQAETELEKLVKGGKGADVLVARAEAHLKELRAPERKVELDADRAFQELQLKARSKGLTKGVQRELERFYQQRKGTRAGDRARHLLSLTER